MGTVKSVQNYGAGDIVEVETAPGQTVFVPFTKRAVPDVDIDGGRIVIDPPAETEAKADDAGGNEASGESEGPTDGLDGNRAGDFPGHVSGTPGGLPGPPRAWPPA